MTQTGALVGTMEYMSPEQALAKELDQRSDIFSAGLIFYELLTGQMPYRADSALASLIRSTQERAKPISEHDASIPQNLSNIVAKCLERAGLVQPEEVEQSGRPDKRVYTLTPAGADRVREWLSDLSWTKVAPVDFHLKLVAAALTGLADPFALLDAQRLELLRRLRDLQDIARNEDPASEGVLLLEGAALRLQADIRWLETCERWLAERKTR